VVLQNDTGPEGMQSTLSNGAVHEYRVTAELYARQKCESSDTRLMSVVLQYTTCPEGMPSTLSIGAVLKNWATQDLYARQTRKSVSLASRSEAESMFPV